MNKGFADLCLTTWLRRHSSMRKRKDEDFSFKFAVFGRTTASSGYNTENQKLKTDSSFFRLDL